MGGTSGRREPSDARKVCVLPFKNVTNDSKSLPNRIRVQSSGFRVEGGGLKVEGRGFRDQLAGIPSPAHAGERILYWRTAGPNLLHGRDDLMDRPRARGV